MKAVYLGLPDLVFLHYFVWEEGLIPPPLARRFSWTLTDVFATSEKFNAKNFKHV